MASNPMQRQKRNSFLLGMLVMLLITGIVIGFLVFYIFQMKKEEEKELAAQVEVLVLTEDVASGTEIGNKYMAQSVDRSLAPVTDLATESEIINAVSKLNLKAGTILSKVMLTESENKITDDLRIEEYNMLSLPVEIEENNFVDVRLTLPTGENFIVISKKKVQKVMDNTIWLQVTEDEILTMSNAIVDAYQMTGSKLSVNLYVEPGMQKDATPTYMASAATINLINKDPNVVDEARRALAGRINNGDFNDLRTNGIDGAINRIEEETRRSNEETKMQEEIENRKTQREEYLRQLNQSTMTEEE